MTTVAIDAVTDPLRARQLFGVDVDHVARSSPLVPAHRKLWFQILELSQTQTLHKPSNGGKGSHEGLGDTTWRAALMP